jgi:hypothetical protein
MMSEATVTDIRVQGGDEAEAVVSVTVEVTEYDVDGDGVTDIVEMVTTTTIDVDGDGVVDVIDVVTAVGVDVNGDGVLDGDEIQVTETIYARDPAES